MSMLRLAPGCPSPYCDDVRMIRAFIRDTDEDGHRAEIPIRLVVSAVRLARE